MHLLSVAQFQVLGIGVEVRLEVGYGHAVGMLVVYAESAAHIDVLYFDVVSFQLVLQFIDSVAESLEVTHVKYLTANMEVQAEELDVLHGCSFCNDTLHVLHGNTEFVFCQSCGDVGMCVCSYVRIDAKANLCCLVLSGSQLVDDFQFGNTLHVEAEDAFLQSEIDLPVALAHTGIYDLVGRKSCVDSSLYFSSAHAVGS